MPGRPMLQKHGIKGSMNVSGAGLGWLDPGLEVWSWQRDHLR